MDPSVCVSLSNNSHGKRFFNRRTYITAVVGKTPEKAPPEGAEPSQSDVADTSGSDTSGEESEVEKTASKSPCTKLFSSISAPGKRTAKSSPEITSENSKRNKKKKKQINLPPKLSGLPLGRVWGDLKSKRK